MKEGQILDPSSRNQASILLQDKAYLSRPPMSAAEFTVLSSTIKMGTPRSSSNRTIIRYRRSKIHPTTADQMEPPIRIHQSTRNPASSRYPSTGPNAHEASSSPDTRWTASVCRTRTGTTGGATSNGTPKTVRCGSTATTSGNGKPTWTWPIRPPTIGSVRRTHANASALETTYADPGQGNIKFDREKRFVH